MSQTLFNVASHLDCSTLSELQPRLNKQFKAQLCTLIDNIFTKIGALTSVVAQPYRLLGESGNNCLRTQWRGKNGVLVLTLILSGFCEIPVVDNSPRFYVYLKDNTDAHYFIEYVKQALTEKSAEKEESDEN